MSDVDGPAGLDLAEYLDHRDRAGGDQLLWENNGWSLRGEAEGREFLLWVSPYFLKGYPGGAFRLDRAALNQTMLILADDPERPLDRPNGFWSAGWEPHEYAEWSDWTVDANADSVTWRDGQRAFRTDGSGWRISGSHAGVDLDVRLASERDALWLSPRAESLDERQDRWWIADADATGTMTVDGATLEIHAHALHERHIHLGTSYNPVTLLRGGGVTWHSGAAPGLRYSVLARPSLGRFWALIDIDGHLAQIRDSDQVTVQAEEFWTDPETGLQLPRSWTLRAETPELRLHVRTTAHARAYYLWNFLRDGVTVLYWWLCTSTGQVTGPGGTRDLGRIRSEVHLNKTLYEAPREGARHVVTVGDAHV